MLFLSLVLFCFAASANPDPGPFFDSDWFDQDQQPDEQLPTDQEPDDQIATDNDPSGGDEVGCALILL